MRFRYAVTAVITAFAAVMSIAPQSAAAANDTQRRTDEVVMLVNLEREAAGLSPLYAVPSLNQIASFRSEELVTSFSHTRPDGSKLSSLLTNINWMSWGENIAYGYNSVNTPEAVVDLWMHSEGHRANILNAGYQYIGVGLYQENNAWYWTQVFISANDLEGAYLPAYASGDVNADNKIDSSDAAVILEAASRLGVSEDSGLTALQLQAADVDQNGEINAADAAYILSYSAISGTRTVSLEDVVSGRVS